MLPAWQACKKPQSRFVLLPKDYLTFRRASPIILKPRPHIRMLILKIVVKSCVTISAFNSSPCHKKEPRNAALFLWGSSNEKRVYLTAIIAAAVSSMRQEKPHSLSYQLMTRTKVPSMTFVSFSAKMDERGSWLKSVETSGSS